MNQIKRKNSGNARRTIAPQNNTQIQIFSDIHLEHFSQNMKRIFIPEVKAKYLILAGDIGNLHNSLLFRFLDACSENWDKVVYVPGNHEFYSDKYTYSEMFHEYSQKISDKYSNVYFLNNSAVLLEPNLEIYGSIFWTPPTFARSDIAARYINDYNRINVGRSSSGSFVKLNSEFLKYESNYALDNLTAHLAERPEQIQTIIVTHFPPLRTNTSHPKYAAQSPHISGYFSWPDEILKDLELRNVVAWISGHTHYCYDFVGEQNVRFISNQIGYYVEAADMNLKHDGVWSLIMK